MSIAVINLVYSDWQILPPVFAIFLGGFVAGYIVAKKNPTDAGE